MNPLDLVNLSPLMKLTAGNPDIKVGLIDGPVATNHPDISSENIREIPGKNSGSCSQKDSAACQHGTYVAGILSAKRVSPAPAICPDCTLLLRPIFLENKFANGQMPSATPDELSAALIDCIDAGAHVINLSVSLLQQSSKGIDKLKDVLDYSVRCGVVVVTAAGNQGTVGSTPITRHCWVIPVAACGLQGQPVSYSNLGNSIGKRGLRAPGDKVTSLGAGGKTLALGGTSAAAPFVSGTLALLWSVFPCATVVDLKCAVIQTTVRWRKTVVPPLLDAWAAYQALAKIHHRQEARMT
jgi:subtilisin family serine protease